ncbi:MAG: nicotinate (nicotinamide) nucleotide adenylyltransferase [Alphaproteobacteria bacterium]|nr:nicotinate (nicotinamide) nucleotide adenylyltransferase [Alphaproteobacteria bacterium]
MKIGLLGGSFNPAHDGHLHISRDAKRRLGLDQVWWLVSPQNPLKPTAGMGPLSDRVAGAEAVATCPWIRVTDLEQNLGTDRTWKTLQLLRTRFPKAQFVWLMGADNLAQIPNWSRWSKIFQSVHVAVFDRSPYSHKALSGKAAWRFASRRLRAARPVALWQKKNPMWVYVAQRRHGASSTAIRSGRDD